MVPDNSGSLTEQAGDFFLRILGDQTLVEMVHASLTETARWEERKRRLPAPVVVWLTLMLALHRSLSIPNAFLKLRVASEERWPELPTPPFQVAGEALCHARTRLGFRPLMNLFGKTAEGIRPEPSFAGLRPWVIDGTTCDMPDTEANEEHFGRPKVSRGEAAFPQLKMVPLMCATSSRIKAVRVLGCSESETAALHGLLSHVPKGDVVFVDRGFASYGLVPQCQQRGIHVVMRISASYKPKIEERIEPGDYMSSRGSCQSTSSGGSRRSRPLSELSRKVLNGLGKGGIF